MNQPRRIVSLVPSLTELLCWLGAGHALVGRTRFCTEPAAEVAGIPTVGGTKNPRVDAIVGLAPDLVVASREENRREDVEALAAAGLRVLVTDPIDVETALATVADLGRIVGAAGRAADLMRETRDALSQVRAPGLPVCVLLWKNPWMALGSDSYGHDLVQRCGGRNVFADRKRYPSVTFEDVSARRPGLILLPDEPYPFTPGDTGEWAPLAPTTIIDGRLLWWYGPRMPLAVRTLGSLFRQGAV